MRTFVSVAVLMAGLTLAVAQDQTTTPKPEAKPAPVIVRVQLPRGWKALGLTDSQRKAVLTARAQFAARRKELEAQIKALKAEEMSALEKLLTDAQRQRLAETKK